MLMSNSRLTSGALHSGLNAGSAALALLVAALAAGLGGCASTDAPVTSVAQANADIARDFRVASGDKVKITVFDEPNLTGEYQIGLDGRLDLPLIGRIAAAGASTSGLSESITTKLRDGGYVLAPRVAVEVTQHQPIFVLGEVKTPGQYPYVSEMTLEQAVAEAGGFTARASKGSVVLRRQQWGNARKIRLGNEVLQISPGDTITVEEAFF
jgi:polysaccharide export outer membrane protein